MNLMHVLPPMLRHVAASIYGYRIRGYRYGPKTPKLIEEALERESWNCEQWKKWRLERLEQMLVHAARNVPYYRNQWSMRRRKGDEASPAYLENWPVLEKDIVRSRPREFIADGYASKDMAHVYTSGTTGMPTELWWSKESMTAYYALREARIRHRFGTTVDEPWAILGGRVVAPVEQARPPFWVWNRALHQLYLSSYHLSCDNIPSYLAALRRYGVTHIYAYTSSLVAFANGILATDEQRMGMKVAITNAEPLLGHQRSLISNVFECPVCETYGMAEGVAAASECPEGHLHLWPEVGYLEVQQMDRHVSVSGSGDLICTAMLRIEMPLIRYRVGDCASISSGETSCSCGSRLPVMGSILGRTDDILYTRDGRWIGRLDPVFKGDLAIKEAQIVQENLGTVRVLVVPDAGYSENAGVEIADRLRARMGPLHVQLEEVNYIPREPNGKFRAVVCNVSAKELSEAGVRHIART